MRQHSIFSRLVLGLGLSLAVAAPMAVSTDAHADARSDARTHYQAGVRAYNAGDYKTAIREFSDAQSLAPADLNNYNLALCYDKLGEPDSAIQYYRAYLDKVPSTDKRGEIEASIARLDAAAKSLAAKKAEEARKAEEAKKAIEAKKAEDQRKADEEAARKKAEEDAAAKKQADEEAARKKAEADARANNAPPIGPVGPNGPVGTGVGSTGTPGTGTARPTGDAQLDRIQNLNIDQIRDERVGAGGSGIPDRRNAPGRVDPRTGRVATGPAVNGNDQGQVGQGQVGPDGRAPTTGPQQQPVADAASDKQKPQQPVYKKWWFWAVVAVSAYVVYSIASDDSKSGNQARTMLPLGPQARQPGGLTLMRF